MKKVFVVVYSDFSNLSSGPASTHHLLERAEALARVDVDHDGVRTRSLISDMDQLITTAHGARRGEGTERSL